MHPTNGPPSSKSSSTPAASTLRPRTRRLISVEDELYPASDSEYASPLGSRAASPVPNAHPSRPNVTSDPTSSFVRSASAHTPRALRDTSSTLSGLWGNSWSAIQGLATNVLGNEAGATGTSTRRRKPLLATHRRTTSSAPPKQWGPSASSTAHVGAGMQEERDSMVRAMKRKDLLTANEHLMPDSVGRIKRRNSDERLSVSAPPAENEDRDALVYIHKVRPQDTLAGISIKFNCQPAILRKANRMWPNDSVQIKDTIVVPVDACGVKGRRVAGPDAHQEDDLLLGDYGDSLHSAGTDSNSIPNGWSSLKSKDPDTPSILSSSQSHTEEPPWKHDSWVLLPNDTEPTEIGRMPRRALGFFPPARRKSLAFSDASTPRPSVDLPRSSTSTNSHATSPTHSTTRPRASSNLSSISGPHGRHRSTSGFHLHGPGGVGTMGKNVRSPGPAQDGLNKLFASHLPDVNPPPDQEYFTPWAPSLLDAGSGTTVQHGGSGARTPLSGAGIDFQEIGGAIEGWVRKVGSQATKLLSEPSTPGQGKRSAVPVIGAVGGDLGDLIELRDDAFEIGDGEESRGRTGRDDTLIPTSEQYQSARPDINLVIRDRGRKGDSSKTD
ncbi:carbohydrate-binding module family 50 protein [Trematosphaeria pertusa]|uniref:Carbohydrate-binding module family 50 protein n=1 Tax=Trematosphaeria pertusa TaxID=390896 RepID=A0A6A6I079_9PLEO|nr:carbohydrate-binding module family 50 protein [Trematosphaeria pertusa]KAF2242970.1 carbohydrate-binding module family 50 protein [Trematosphaeria pertusa]